MESFATISTSMVTLVLMLCLLFAKTYQKDMFITRFSVVWNLEVKRLGQTREMTKVECAHTCLRFHRCRSFFYSRKLRLCRTYRTPGPHETGKMYEHSFLATKEKYCPNPEVMHIETSLSSSALLRVGGVIRSYKCVYPYSPCREAADPLTCQPSLQWKPSRVCFRTIWDLFLQGPHHSNVRFRLKCLVTNASIEISGATIVTTGKRTFGVVFVGGKGNISHMFTGRSHHLKMTMTVDCAGVECPGAKLFLSHSRWRYEHDMSLRFIVNKGFVGVDLEGRFANYMIPWDFIIKEVQAVGMLNIKRLVVKL